MTEHYQFFGSAEGDQRTFSQADFATVLKRLLRDGVFDSIENELAVSASDPAAMSVRVATGQAWIQGYWYRNDAVKTLTIAAADPTHARIDRVVLQLDTVTDRVISAVVVAGTPAASPTAPALTRTSSVWEISLAQIAVGAGVTSVSAGNITDERGDASLCGVACPPHVLSSQLEIVSAVDMDGNALTGLPEPSGDSDAATKAYVNSEIASFGISDITIDVDKDWNGKSISNAGTVAAAALTGTTVTGDLRAVKYTGSAGDSTVKSAGPITGSSLGSGAVATVATLTMPAGLQASPLRFKITGSNESPNSYSPGMWGIRVLVGGVQMSDSASAPSADVSVEEGDVVTLQVHVGATGVNSYSISGYLQIGVLSPVVEVVAPVW